MALFQERCRDTSHSQSDENICTIRMTSAVVTRWSVRAQFECITLVVGILIFMSSDDLKQATKNNLPYKTKVLQVVYHQ